MKSNLTIKDIEAMRQSMPRTAFNKMMLEISEQCYANLDIAKKAHESSIEAFELAKKYRKGNRMLCFVAVPVGIVFGYMLAGIL